MDALALTPRKAKARMDGWALARASLWTATLASAGASKIMQSRNVTLGERVVVVPFTFATPPRAKGLEPRRGIRAERCAEHRQVTQRINGRHRHGSVYGRNHLVLFHGFHSPDDRVHAGEPYFMAAAPHRRGCARPDSKPSSSALRLDRRRSGPRRLPQLRR